MSVSIDDLKTALDRLPATEREELARHLMDSLTAEDAGTTSRWHSFLQGMGSTLEFFPPPERLDPWRATQDVVLEQWPLVARNLLRELLVSGSDRDQHDTSQTD